MLDFFPFVASAPVFLWWSRETSEANYKFAALNSLSYSRKKLTFEFGLTLSWWPLIIYCCLFWKWYILHITKSLTLHKNVNILPIFTSCKIQVKFTKTIFVSNYPLLLCLSPTVSQYRWTYALSVAVREDGNSNSRW